MNGQPRNRLVCMFAGMLCLTVLMGGVRSAAQLPTTPNIDLPAVNGTVRAIVKDGNRVYIGGNFTTVGGLARNHLAAIDATTWQVDPAWNPDVNGTVLNIVVAGGHVYASGDFTAVNGATARTGAAAFHPANGIDTGLADAWNPVITGGTVIIPGLAVAGSKVYVGGYFSTVNGVARNKLAAIGAAGTPQAGQLDAAWNPALPLLAADSVRCILPEGGNVYVGCAIDKEAPPFLPYEAVFALEPADGVKTGRQDPVWRLTSQDSDFITQSMLAYGGKLYVGGFIAFVNGVARMGVVALSLADGVHPAKVDPAWNPFIEITDLNHAGYGVFSLAVMDQKLLVGGWFQAVNGSVPWNNLASFGLADGTDFGRVNTSWNLDPSRAVCALCPFEGGLLVGGRFDRFGGHPIEYLAGFSTAVPVEMSGFSAH